MSEKEIKESIQQAIASFATLDTVTASEKLLNTLGYKSSKKANVNLDTLKKRAAERKIVGADAFLNECSNAKLLFQYSDDEVKKQSSLFEVGYNDTMKSYLFFAVGLKNKAYPRTQISNLTRFINRLYDIPVMLIFHYDNLLTVSVINRRLNKRDSDKDVLEKVTQIKDILIPRTEKEVTHRAHIEILFDLSFEDLKLKHQFTNFETLHTAWQKTLDTKLLNEKFFGELSNWYFWAQNYVEFPKDKKLSEEKNIQNNLIRLITRLIFVWFLKEKHLVGEILFDKKKIGQLLKKFDANGEQTKSYYNAILQNLFFATLNQKMNERGFAKDGDFETNRTEHGVKNKYRYSSAFNISEREVIDLFKDVPFLNGGLFDCLDKDNEETGKHEYIDGFSRDTKRTAKIPDLLFFGNPRSQDLSKGYGYKRVNEQCRGIIEIFADYKFTIEENTPIDEEVALDPELLGKVFENLLAYYNPETETTARKQTGSFYTPREIVNYMVDESLIGYLKTQLLEDQPSWLELGNLQSEMFGNEGRKGQLKMQKDVSKSRWKGKEKELESNLRHLVAYSNEPHLFKSEEDVQQLIYAIDHCKILDPACGSGAFPMGILHKLVYVLGKIDQEDENKNSRWRLLQKKKTEYAISKALDEKNRELRAEKLIEINKIFEDNASDYGRKLYLIENCIYGVDIQPIAVQISKLRFFISLVVDQKENKSDNRGIRPLPNLETKFVAANTLIGLEKPAQLPIGYDLIEPMQDELQQIRHRHFEAKSRKEKIKCQKEDKVIRKKISEQLKGLGFGNRDADKIAKFDIYDQNASAGWFESEWMFGKDLKRGFNIVIGNPPWGAKLTEEEKDYLTKKFPIVPSKIKDSYLYFLTKSMEVLSPEAFLSLIIPNTWLLINNADKFRSHILSYKIIEIDDYGDGIFEQATVESSTLFVVNTKDKAHPVKVKRYKKLELVGDNLIDKKMWSSDSLCRILLDINSSNKKIMDLAERNSEPFAVNNQIIWGIKPYQVGYGKPPQTESDVKNRIYHSTYSKGKDWHPLLVGGNVNRYVIQRDDLEFIKYGVWLMYTSNIHVMQSDKILVRQTSDVLRAAFDDSKFLAQNSLFLIHSNKYNLKFLTALLNSSFINFIYKIKNPQKGKVFAEVKPSVVKELPIYKADEKTQTLFSDIVNFIIELKKLKKDSNFFERLIDAMVYELYLSDVIKAASCEVLKYLMNLPKLKDGEDEKNLKIIEKVYKELSDTKHPISSALLRMINIPEIEIIEAKK